MFNREKMELKRVPMMPVREMVIFPQQMVPFIVGREASVRALEEALAGEKRIFLATQHDASVDDPSKLSDTIAANLQIPVEEKQELLEMFDPLERLNRVAEILEVELEKLNVDRNINTRVKRQMERAQKEYYLNEKMKAIQKELGRGEKNEIDELKKKIDSAGMSKEVHEKAIQELKRLEMMPPMSAESTVSRNYLDWLLAVPWKKKSKEIRDIALAEKILEEDHYGLEKIKERILE